MKYDNRFLFSFILFVKNKKELTRTGLAAIRSPATPPPTTRPSGLAKETLIPPARFLVPPLSVGTNDPVKESISKRPYKKIGKKMIRFSLEMKSEIWKLEREQNQNLNTAEKVFIFCNCQKILESSKLFPCR